MVGPTQKAHTAMGLMRNAGGPKGQSHWGHLERGSLKAKRPSILRGLDEER